jgi:hypothetical protein
MKRSIGAILLMSVAICGLGLGTCYGEAESKPIQLALFNPVQIYNESLGIAGVRLNLLYGRNAFMRGLDVGLVNVCGTGESYGLQWGVAGFVEGEYTGLQVNFFNITKGRFAGFQWGVYNDVGDGEAFQWGFANVAKNMRGLQLGLFNYTETMYGLQIGIVNVISKKEKLPVFVIVNWSF